MRRRYARAVIAYLVPTFVLGYVWHLILFEDYYAALSIYRSDIIIPLGLLSITVQAVLFAWLYTRAFSQQDGSWIAIGLRYAGVGALLSWSFTTLAVAAKNVMSSVPDYLVIETAFTTVQWLIVGPLTALVFDRASHPSRVVAAS